MPKFTILTPAKTYSKTFATLDDAIEWAKGRMPMKRGWTFEVEVDDKSDILIDKVNTKGEYVKGESVKVIMIESHCPSCGNTIYPKVEQCWEPYGDGVVYCDRDACRPVMQGYGN